VSAKHTKRGTEPRKGRADLRRVRAMTEAEIEATSPPELSDIPHGFWDDAEMVRPPSKEAISLRVDSDVLQWFRSAGPRYQSRMNAVLRSYMVNFERRRPRRRKDTSKDTPA
jgi:uncharacterized protein (DUF4415 family)